MEHFENSIKISNEFIGYKIDTIKSIVLECNELSKSFSGSHRKEKHKLPYHINVIDELRAIENAHSRILVKLFKYKLNDEFIILDSFLKHFSNEYQSFKFTHSIVNPNILQEKKRIDASIVDNDYAIIIENKINNAADIRGQIDRYISRLNRKDLYVIYLTRKGGSPPEESFSNSKKTAILKNYRYLEISYLNDILPWLENKILPNKIHQNEKFLKSSLEQYIDHLKGLFNLRKINIIMDDKLINQLGNLLNLGNNYELNLDLLKEKIENLSLTKNYLNKLYYKQQILSWKEKIEKDFSSYNFETVFDDGAKYKHVGIVFKIPSIGDCSVLLQITPEGKSYFGVSKYFCKTGSNVNEIKDFVNNNKVKRDNIGNNNNWYFWSLASSYNRAYELFKQQVFTMLEGINSHKELK